VRLVLIGLAAGVFSALFGVGGGLLIVPLLILLAGFETRPATGTSLAAVLITVTVGAATYALHGDVKPGSAALIGIPAVFGVLVGTAAQQRIPTRPLGALFGLFVAAVAIRLILS
jgi:uncharacterized membrane protein YfcA